MLLVAFLQELPFLWSLCFFFFVPCSKALTIQTQPVPVSLLCPWADSQSGSSSLVLWPDTTEEGSSKGSVD